MVTITIHPDSPIYQAHELISRFRFELRVWKFRIEHGTDILLGASTSSLGHRYLDHLNRLADRRVVRILDKSNADTFVSWLYGLPSMLQAKEMNLTILTVTHE